MASLASSQVTRLVDETKLHGRIGVMLVGAAGQSRCLPLARRTYRADDDAASLMRALWGEGCGEPWALVTHDSRLTGHKYARRNRQEQRFGDLNSGGWHWGDSRRRHPRSGGAPVGTAKPGLCLDRYPRQPGHDCRSDTPLPHPEAQQHLTHHAG